MTTNYSNSKLIIYLTWNSFGLNQMVFSECIQNVQSMCIFNLHYGEKLNRINPSWNNCK